MKFTYYTIIGKDLKLLMGHIDNVKNYAGFDKLTCKKEIIVIVYRNKTTSSDVTKSILEYCEKQNISTEVYLEPDDTFIHNLYACWNLGYHVADDGYVFRGGSDQVFSRDSFVALYDEAMKIKGQKIILQANTIENSVKLQQIRATSRHFTEDFGGVFENFDFGKFERFCERINEPAEKSLIDIQTALGLWGRPTSLMTSLGQINRVDGCSWLMTKEDWKRYGPLPVIVNGITGDVIIHDTLQNAGYTEYIVRDCITYHFVQGER